MGGCPRQKWGCPPINSHLIYGVSWHGLSVWPWICRIRGSTYAGVGFVITNPHGEAIPRYVKFMRWWQRRYVVLATARVYIFMTFLPLLNDQFTQQDQPTKSTGVVSMCWIQQQASLALKARPCVPHVAHTHQWLIATSGTTLAFYFLFFFSLAAIILQDMIRDEQGGAWLSKRSNRLISMLTCLLKHACDNNTYEVPTEARVRKKGHPWQCG